MPEQEKNELKGIRTLQTDVQELEKKGISAADLATEMARRRSPAIKEETAKYSFKKIALILAIIIVIIGLGFGVFQLFFSKIQEKQPVSLIPKPILVSDQQVEAGADLNSIQSALKTPIRINNLLYVSMAMRPEEFFKIIKANPPSELTDSLTGGFMLSKFYLSKDWPILILSIRSYESAFAGMLKWEKTMGQDLSAIFNSANAGDFQDKEIQNHDTRTNSVLIYSFINRNYLVIVQNEEPLKEIFRRFSSPQYLNE